MIRHTFDTYSINELMDALASPHWRPSEHLEIATELAKQMAVAAREKTQTTSVKERSNYGR